MPNIEPSVVGKDVRVAILTARFHEAITSRLLEEALAALKEAGVAEKDITTAWVPGAYELPLAAKRFANSGRFDAVLCLGAVVRGETPHFDFVAGQAAAGILQASLGTDTPVIFGVLTTSTLEQAEARISTARSGALAAIEMAQLLSCV